MTAKSTKFNMRIPLELKQAIQEAAAADRRSMAEWLLVLAERELERAELARQERRDKYLGVITDEIKQRMNER